MDWYISWGQSWLAGSWSVEEQQNLARVLTDTLDDEWRWILPWWVQVIQTSFGTWEIERLADEPYVISYDEWEIARLLRVQLTSVWLWTPNGTSTQPYLDDDTMLQDEAPFPASLYGERFWHEKLWWSSSQRNAARFSIASGIDLKAFGTWIGDLETRTDGEGWPWEVLLFDAEETLIDRKIIEANDTSAPHCWSNDGSGVCGNQSTRWIWFVVPDDISDHVAHIVISVWDDDTWDDENTTWTTEHISLIWPTFVFSCTDTDADGVCDDSDVCPDNPEKSTELWCGCNSVDPLGLWDVCVSDANSCGDIWTGAIQCDGSCSAIIPQLVDSYDEVCVSASNSCGQTLTGTIACDGVCSADIPAQSWCADSLSWNVWWWDAWWWTTEPDNTESGTWTIENTSSGSWSSSTQEEEQDASGSWFVLPGWLPDTWVML